MLVGRPHRKHVVRPSTFGAGAGLGGGGIKPHGVAGAVGRGLRGKKKPGGGGAFGRAQQKGTTLGNWIGCRSAGGGGGTRVGPPGSAGGAVVASRSAR